MVGILKNPQTYLQPKLSFFGILIDRSSRFSDLIVHTYEYKEDMYKYKEEMYKTEKFTIVALLTYFLIYVCCN